MQDFSIKNLAEFINNINKTPDAVISVKTNDTAGLSNIVNGRQIEVVISPRSVTAINQGIFGDHNQNNTVTITQSNANDVDKEA